MKSNIFRKVMVATDGSEISRRAVDTAIEIAKLSEAKLYAVHVIALGGYSIINSRGDEWKKAMRKQLISEINESTTYVENSGRAANIKVESLILEGSPAEELIDFAEKRDIDLIVMGTQGKTAIKRFLIGSITEKVVRYSNKKVLIVR
jgi:nucleotide-binding universal stress UspA family protein